MLVENMLSIYQRITRPDFFCLNTIENCLCRDVIVTQNVDYGTSNVLGDACRQETT
jgi:hypothetical protein